MLQVRVVEGEGVSYPAGSRATRGITVEVVDEAGRPVDGASVGFQLPADGPGGTFATGTRMEIATTHADGRAGVWGMQWNRTVGSFEIRIVAAKGKARAGTVCAQHLTAATSSSAHAEGRRGHKWLWIALGAAGAAAGGVAAVELMGNSGSGSGAPVGLQIGTPTISLGHTSIHRGHP